MKRNITSKNYISSKFVCTECGQENMFIPRSRNAQRENGHIKDLWCYHCKKITKNMEMNEMETCFNKNFDVEL